MRLFVLAASSLCTITFVSCGPNEGGGIRYQPANTSAPAAIVPADGSGGTPLLANARLNPAHGQPGHRCDIAVGAPLPAAVPNFNPAAAGSPLVQQPAVTTPVIQPSPAPVPVAATAAGINPAHGQPGHRCDIPVGQPLSSKPVAASATPATPVKPVLPPDTMFAKGLNPAHGQPGHRCDIAVGQPLNTATKKS